jgi:glycosyltransferase involved in cell wall biosynthesis
VRLHVIGLPHTETTSDYNQCAYTAKVRKFATMMTRRGYEVFLYSSGRNEAECTEHIPVLSLDAQQRQFRKYPWWVNKEWFGLDWNSELPYWRSFNHRVIAEISERIEPQDFICFITGSPQASIIESFPSNMSVEYGIGYEGVYAPYRVFESYAWMHTVYGKMGPSSADGRFYDAVIPNYYDADEFPERRLNGDSESYLFMSRMTPRKGYDIAIELTRRLGAKLIVAGTGGDRPQHDHVEYVGYADTETRGQLLSSCKALLCPTLYLEPFGGVVAEAMLCGTPVLTTDWGAFTETVRDGVDGFRCRTLKEFEAATGQLQYLNNAEIRNHAQARFSTEVVGAKYDVYFKRLMGLWGDGFYE